MGSRFETSLKPSKAKWVGGYKAGAIDPSKIADEVMGQVDGPWLTCYMLRRFGWPNFGSDDYKELCSWSLVTPLPGLWMTVTPFLGGGNLHFGILFDAETGRQLERDPGRESFWRRRDTAIRAWWKRRAKAALAATMRDLLRPISVRDIGFSVLGRDEGKGPSAPRFEGAGCTPEYWYSAKAKRARRQMTRG